MRQITESKSTRDYIRNWGRTAARQMTPQGLDVHTDTGIKCGTIHIYHNEHDNDFEWRAEVKWDADQTIQKICSCESDARTWVQETYYYMHRSHTLGQYLQMQMKPTNLGMTRSEMCDALQVSRITLYHWLSDARVPNYQNMQQVSVYLAGLQGITVQQMAGLLGLLQYPTR